MGYFSNGSEGLMYEDVYCEVCVHQNADHGCPCWSIHLQYNYEECNNKDSILHKMIPIDEETGMNLKCIFYKGIPKLIEERNYAKQQRIKYAEAMKEKQK